MRILVLSAFYPKPNGTHERMFVHVRNQYYKKQGLEVTVLNFDTNSDYIIDGIEVISPKTYDLSNNRYDIAVSHSANLRNHYIWLKKHEKEFAHLVFFFHGHECLYLNRDYPKPFGYLINSKWYYQLVQNTYDWFKTKVWGNYYKRIAYKSSFIFVSRWVHERFLTNTGLKDDSLQNRFHIINNSVGSIFEEKKYDPAKEKKYDYITIRSNLDGSKYCIDLVTEFANKNPEQVFLVIGKGSFFEHYHKPENIIAINKTIDHAEMIDYIDASRCALMLTREDTQGVMTCELATYGIPVITSDIEVCHEMFDGLKNVVTISNESTDQNISQISRELFNSCPYENINRFSSQNTILKEVELFQSIERGMLHELTQSR